MKKINLTILTTLLVVGLATAAFSWGGGPGGPCGRGPGYGPCDSGDMSPFSRLNLSDEQKEKIRTLQESQWKETKPLRDKMFSKRGDLKLLWLEKNPDQEKIMAAQKELRAVRDQMQDKMTAHRLAIFKILTPEQQGKIQSYMGRGMGRGHGMGMGPCGGGGSCSGGGPRGF